MAAYILFFGVMILSWLVQARLKHKFNLYSKMGLRLGMSGREVAETMLSHHGIEGVKVMSVPGHLSDHYNPNARTVNLSPEVFNGRSVAAAAVAAHECGHAVQHATAYSWLQMRSALVPVVSFSSRIVQWVLLAGILLLQAFPQLLLIGIVLFALTTLFSFITLPVELDASRRALAWLRTTQTTTSQEQEKAKDALKWAALTYVVAAVGSLATLLYYIMIFMGRRE
ncbi:MAG TPA: zinc metallopeptidase [Bacteroidales bacterium]|nr:zinc metallopeptidase [Bacteroidales bacterium]